MIKKIAVQYSIRIVGPNCLGVINPRIGLNASFAINMPLKGDIGFISQSGALAVAMLDFAIKNDIGLSKFISVSITPDARPSSS